jgi:hypothetical protein
MKINRGGIALALLLASILAGCKGGSASTPPTLGSVNVSLTDGPGSDYDHVWVTVKAISFHTDPNQIWDSSDATWQTTTLTAPLTLDLASLTNGALNQVFAGMSLPVGGYRQIRLFLAGFDDTLTASASAVTPTALIYNDQVDYTDANGTQHHVPLEIAYPTQGIQLNGSFDVPAPTILNPSLNLALDFDLEHDLVRFKPDINGTEYYFTMAPNLRYFDLDQSGAITGQVNTTNLCSGTPLTGCGYNMIVKAELLSADGTRHRDIRSTTIDSNGSFTLYPLPVLSAGQTYDVLIRGRNIETMLVKGVTAPVGSTPTGGAAVLSNAAIPLTIDGTGEYFANFSTALNPKSGYALFQQTLPSEVPYEVRWGNTNPFTGIPELPIALSNDPLQVANYTGSGIALIFSPVTPQEGNGGYSVATNGLPLAYYSLSSSIPVASSGVPNIITSPLTFPPPAPTLSSSVVPGTVSGTITQTTPGTYDSGYLVMSRFANIVDTVDISTQLAANNSGAYSVMLPAGGWPIPSTTAYANVPGAYYYAYLRVWHSGINVEASTKIIPIPGIIDLRNVSTVTGINVTTLP